MKLTEEEVGSILECTCTGAYFLNITPVTQTLISAINKWDLLKQKIFCKGKDTVSTAKCQPSKWEKIFTSPTSHRGLISKIFKEIKKIDI